MFSSKHTSGFNRAPVCKTLLGGVVSSSLLLSFPLQQHRAVFIYTPSQIFDQYQIWKMLTAKLAFLDLKDLFICSMLIYYFRIFERRFGSRKFVSYLLGTGLLATLLEVLTVFLCWKWKLPLGPLPSGPMCLVYPLFVPFYCDIPRVTMGHILGIPVTGKSFYYILGLHVASGSRESIVVAVCGLLAGVLWRANILKIQSVVRVPQFVARLCHGTIGKLLDSGSPVEIHGAPIGATLELQRQEQMERMEHQMVWQSLQNQQNGRNLQIGRPQPQNLANGPGLFGAGNNNQVEDLNLDNGNNAEAAEESSEVTEEQVQLLVEMGFNQEQVRQALQVSNNDISMATNILLQES